MQCGRRGTWHMRIFSGGRAVPPRHAGRYLYDDGLLRSTAVDNSIIRVDGFARLDDMSWLRFAAKSCRVHRLNGLSDVFWHVSHHNLLSEDLRAPPGRFGLMLAVCSSELRCNHYLVLPPPSNLTGHQLMS